MPSVGAEQQHVEVGRVLAVGDAGQQRQPDDQRGEAEQEQPQEDGEVVVDEQAAEEVGASWPSAERSRVVAADAGPLAPADAQGARRSATSATQPRCMRSKRAEQPQQQQQRRWRRTGSAPAGTPRRSRDAGVSSAGTSRHASCHGRSSVSMLGSMRTVCVSAVEASRRTADVRSRSHADCDRRHCRTLTSVSTRPVTLGSIQFSSSSRGRTPSSTAQDHQRHDAAAARAA